MTSKRLYKSRTERMIDGVCGGIAEYSGLDVTLIRILWVLLTLFGGMGIILYIVAMIVMPAGPVAVAAPGAPPLASATTSPRSNGANAKFWGALLIAFGALLLLNNLGVPIWHHWWGFSWSVVLPLLLILAGVAFLYGGRNGILSPTAAPANDTMDTGPAAEPGSDPVSGPAAPPVFTRTNRLYRSKTERKILGVCGGIANHLNVDPTIIRLLFVIAAFASFGFVLLLYILMAIIVPEEPMAAVPATPVVTPVP